MSDIKTIYQLQGDWTKAEIELIERALTIIENISRLYSSINSDYPLIFIKKKFIIVNWFYIKSVNWQGGLAETDLKALLFKLIEHSYFNIITMD